MTQRVDMLVSGAGPAGVCAALRLNQLGYRVLLVERSRQWPRPQIGEALTPGVRNILDYLDANDALAGVPILAGRPAQLRWAGAAVETVAHDGAVVARAGFDAALLRLAEARGVAVLRPAQIERIEGEAGAWRVQLAGPDGARQVEAGVLLDARGRQAGAGGQRLQAARLATLWAESASGAAADGAAPATRVEALDDGWLWGAALPDGRYRVMLTFDPAARTGGPEAVLRDACRRAVLFRELAELPWCGAPGMCVSTPYVDALGWRDGRIKLGDAAFALDPVSSSGVEKAMRFSLQATVAIHTWCQAADTAERALAQRFYASRLAESAARHLAWTAGYYRQAWCADAPFWRERSIARLTPPAAADAAQAAQVSELADALAAELARAAAPPPAPRERAAPLSWQTPLRFAGDTAIVTLPCVMGDRVAAHPALQHPALDRPVAFWDGIALVPRLERLRQATHPLALLTELGASMDAAKAQRLMQWLWDTRLIEAAEPAALGAAQGAAA